MTINVTQADIENDDGTPFQENRKNAVSRAINRQIPGADCCTDHDRQEPRMLLCCYKVPMPDDVRIFLNDRAHGRTLKPFDFELPVDLDFTKKMCRKCKKQNFYAPQLQHGDGICKICYIKKLEDEVDILINKIKVTENENENEYDYDDDGDD
jgi:hypothetical protein